jgi:hypothetical protein
MRIRTTTRPGASPLPGHRETSDKQTCSHRRGRGTLAPGQRVDDGYTGAPWVSVVGPITVITVVTVGGDR